MSFPLPFYWICNLLSNYGNQGLKLLKVWSFIWKSTSIICLCISYPSITPCTPNESNVDEDNIFNDCNRSASRSNCSLVTSYTCACHPQRGMGVGKVGVKGCAEIMGMKIIGLFVQCLQITERREGKGQTLWLLITMLLSKQTTRLVQNCFRNVP